MQNESLQEIPEEENNILSLKKSAEDDYKFAHFKPALEKFLQLLDLTTPNSMQHIEVILSIVKCYSDMGFYPEAISHLDKAQEITEKHFGSDSLIQAKIWLQRSIFCKIFVQSDLCYDYASRALKINQEKLPYPHVEVAKSFHALAGAHLCQANYLGAQNLLVQSLEILHQYEGEDKAMELGFVYMRLGRVYDRLGKTEDAKDCLDKALESLKSYYGEDHPDIGDVYCTMGNLSDSLGNNIMALYYYRQFLASYEKVFGKDHPAIGDGNLGIGYIYDNLGNSEKALECFQISKEIYTKFFGAESTYVSNALFNIGRVYENNGNNKEALKHYMMTMKTSIKYYGERHAETSDIYHNVGLINLKLINFTESKKNFTKVLLIFKETYGKGSNKYRNIARIIRATDKYQDYFAYLSKDEKIY